MQRLQSSIMMVGVDASLQSIVVGVMLAFAVWVDILSRRRTAHEPARRDRQPARRPPPAATVQ
jgi:ribose/xylose/arabinose/galactoside ABC-type transport system permease subunit